MKTRLLAAIATLVVSMSTAVAGIDEGGTHGIDEGGTKGIDEGGTQGIDEGGKESAGSCQHKLAWLPMICLDFPAGTGK